ncbi:MULTISPECIES: four helix bundle protein [Flavobacterium]|uniref:four helix bundle protein n=1 Tax=Flavobacterium TaxID=237 RepID=UPI001368AE05|nr:MULTISPECIES: four helix bundle protein [Flavobacterium]MXO05157.1 four helix bundle protein [Flavobacterium sp. HBTb2-11-1]URM36887.1 four helix bundle protein [Flavobacterium anhuiense]
MSHFRKILVWQKSISLVTKVYKATRTFPKEETFGLTSQIRRSSISIPSNIAEGSGRESNKDFLRFLYISLGSLFEMQTQLEIAKNIIYISEEEFNLLYEDSREIERMLASLIKKVKDTI